MPLPRKPRRYSAQAAKKYSIRLAEVKQANNKVLNKHLKGKKILVDESEGRGGIPDWRVVITADGEVHAFFAGVSCQYNLEPEQVETIGSKENIGRIILNRGRLGEDSIRGIVIHTKDGKRVEIDFKLPF